MFVPFVAETLPGIPRKPVESRNPHPLRSLLIPCDDHPPLDGRDVFRGVETEGPEIPERPGVAAVDGPLDTMGAILDDPDLRIAGDTQDPSIGHG